MNYYLIFCIILLCCIGIIIILISNYKTKTKTLLKVQNEKYELEKLKKEELKEYFKEEWKTEEEKLNLKISGLESTLKEKEKRYNEVNQDLDLYKKGKIKEIDSAAAEYEQRKQLEIKQTLQQKELQANSDFNNHVDSYIIQKAQMQSEIKEIKAELEVERSKRAAINEQIRKQRELEEQQDFYRIQIDPKDVDDIKILRDIAPRLRHPEAINKVIWNGYYQKPLAELRKRLLPNGDVSCVYMATRMKTLEMYIGQTTSFDKRLQEHTRSALGIGTLASSMLHKKMYEDGPEQFLWQILEVVPKDKLRERESYYIDFYKSNKFGLNTLSGDKNK